jgi:hypothetical protein
MSVVNKSEISTEKNELIALGKIIPGSKIERGGSVDEHGIGCSHAETYPIGTVAVGRDGKGAREKKYKNKSEDEGCFSIHTDAPFSKSISRMR